MATRSVVRTRARARRSRARRTIISGVNIEGSMTAWATRGRAMTCGSTVARAVFWPSLAVVDRRGGPRRGHGAERDSERARGA